MIMLMKKIIALAMAVLVCAALAGCQKIGNDRGVLTVNVPEDYEREEVCVFPYDIIELTDYVSVSIDNAVGYSAVNPGSSVSFTLLPGNYFVGDMRPASWMAIQVLPGEEVSLNLFVLH